MNHPVYYMIMINDHFKDENLGAKMLLNFVRKKLDHVYENESPIISGKWIQYANFVKQLKKPKMANFRVVVT